MMPPARRWKPVLARTSAELRFTQIRGPPNRPPPSMPRRTRSGTRLFSGRSLRLPGKLQLDPDIQAEILRIQIEQLLHPPNVLSALQNIHLNLAEPASGGAFDFKPAPKEEPLVTPGPGPDTPKAGSADDVVSALMKVKAVDNAVSRLRLDASDRVKHDWRSLSGGEKAAVIVTSVLIGGAAIGGVGSDPKSREWALQQLDGKEAPVPGIDGL